MRLTRYATAAAGIVLALGSAACFDDGITDVNANPNAPTTVEPQFVFPQGVTAAVTQARGAGFDLTFTGLWAQYYSKVQYVDEDWYQIRPTTIDAYWSSFYSGALEDLQTAIDQSGDRAGLAGPALVMRAWTLGVMTDIWGDIPFTEALKGEEGMFTPAYDPQEVVYDSLFTSLATAASLLPGDQDYGSADPIYAGDNAKWEKFANSLRARFAMRLSEVDANKAQSELQAAFAAGVFASNADNAVLQYPGGGMGDNGWYTNFLSRDDHRISKAIVDTLLSLNDPRVAVFAAETPAHEEDGTGEPYVGLPNGLSTADAADYLGNGITMTSRLGDFFSQDDTPQYLMTYSEVLFIQAEAVARGWMTGDAAALYNQAITASMNQFGITDAAAISAYLAQPSVAYNPATGLRQIAVQKWISLFGQGVEGWSEWRRTGYPNLTPVPEAKTEGKVIARRLQYPNSEQSFNPANLQAAVSAQGGAGMTNRLWWDAP